jgi:hypothetical protein
MSSQIPVGFASTRYHGCLPYGVSAFKTNSIFFFMISDEISLSTFTADKAFVGGDGFHAGCLRSAAIAKIYTSIYFGWLVINKENFTIFTSSCIFFIHFLIFYFLIYVVLLSLSSLLGIRTTSGCFLFSVFYLLFGIGGGTAWIKIVSFECCFDVLL